MQHPINYLIIYFILFLYLIHLSCNTANPAKESNRPNFVLFLIDDFGYGDISFEGNSQVETPNIDRIAQNSARFTRFYQSGAACAPTRASLLTGRYHLETGVWGVHAGRDFMHLDERTIGNVLQNAGYTTGAFGKWHNGKIWPYFSWNRGYDVGIHSLLYRYFDTKVIFNNKIVHVDGPITDFIGDQVVRFISENRHKPFFAYVPFQAIHEPYNCPEDTFQKYKSLGYSDHVARLYGMIAILDQNVGKILDTIESFGLTEHTVIMFLSDDGPSPGFDLSYSNRRMNEDERNERELAWSKRLRGGKGSIWEGGQLTPFYIQWNNRIEAGKEYDQVSGVIDIFPTILDICGIEIPKDNLPIDGSSIWPVLQGETDISLSERTYFDNTNFYLIPRHEINTNRPEMHHISVYYKNYKLIRGDNTLYGGKPDSIYFLLYDLLKDPSETTSILESEPAMADLLKKKVVDWYDDIIESGRAFRQAVYEIGHWEERVTPINVDAVRELKGSVKRSEQSTFRFDGWTTPGSSMVFDIDVAYQGSFQVELGYHCDTENFGSVFAIYTEYDTASAIIDNENSTFSDTLKLPRGPQSLTVELQKVIPGRNAVETMNRLLVHRIPEKDDTGVLLNAGFRIIIDEEEVCKIMSSSATADFRSVVPQTDPITAPEDSEVIIRPFADNPDEIQSVQLFLGLKAVESKSGAPVEFSLNNIRKGKQTVNIEFTSKEGVTNAAHAELVIQ